jgi:hypothetical protein
MPSAPLSKKPWWSMAAKFLVVDLQVGDCAARLASPAQIISRQYPLDLSVPNIRAAVSDRLLNNWDLAFVELEVDDFSSFGI